MGRRIVEHPLLDDGTRFIVNTGSLRQLINADTPLLLLCNPHNPTGRVFERRELQAIAQVATDADLVVVADEVHADLAYPGNKHVPFASLGPEVAARTVTITSATKAYNIPGMRCGLMHFGSEALYARFRSRLPERFLGRVNRFGIEATVVAWRECAPWLERAMGVLERNRQYLADFIASKLSEVRHYPPEASYLAWLDCRRLDLPVPPQQFFMEHARVALNDGSEFGPPGRGYVRLNFATSQPILEELVSRMKIATRRDRAAV
jgi:cystathionine beta-lyase